MATKKKTTNARAKAAAKSTRNKKQNITKKKATDAEYKAWQAAETAKQKAKQTVGRPLTKEERKAHYDANRKIEKQMRHKAGKAKNASDTSNGSARTTTAEFSARNRKQNVVDKRKVGIVKDRQSTSAHWRFHDSGDKSATSPLTNGKKKKKKDE